MNKTWENCLQHLRQELGEAEYRTWIKPLTVEEDRGVFFIITPSAAFMNKFRRYYFSKIETIILRENVTEIIITTDKKKNCEIFDKNQTSISHIDDKQGGELTPGSGVSTYYSSAMDICYTATEKGPLLADHGISPDYTFVSLVEGQANRFARAHALDIASNPGKHNPFYIYGGTGLGKTHLLHAIGNEAMALHPELVVRYVRSNTYMQEVIQATGRSRHTDQSVEKLRKKYNMIDVLLVDDVQFLNGNKARTQEEFFYTFNDMIDRGAQVVLTADVYPSSIKDLNERLSSRFASGLTVNIEPPEFEMRIAILYAKVDLLKDYSIKLTEEAAFFIANNLRSHVRELEGALNRVIAYARYQKVHEIDVPVCRRALEDVLQSACRNITIEEIQKTVANFYRISLAEVFSAKRSRSVVHCRHMAMALARELTNMSLPQIGASFGGKDHTTVHHAHQRIMKLVQLDETVKNEYHILAEQLRNS